MATSKYFLEFILDMLSEVEGITFRMMMGEYIIYCKGKIAAYVCDNRLLVKSVPSALRLMPQAEYEAVSEGGKKNMLRVDNVENKVFLKELFEAMYLELPEPKQKRRRL
ncbi:MAG: TfoX/Sxy family protein [Clostridia bacterium]|nr:TfoX/Sxy family protein [Clostridia bacterium]